MTIRNCCQACRKRAAPICFRMPGKTGIDVASVLQHIIVRKIVVY